MDACPPRLSKSPGGIQPFTLLMSCGFASSHVPIIVSFANDFMKTPSLPSNTVVLNS